jgi:outer membrane receptor protein involved in Fe transport
MNSRHAIVLIAAAFFAAFTAGAQTPAGEIRLEVKDSSSAGMQASGRIVNAAGNVNRSFRTDAHGQLTLSNLPYGHYHLEVSRHGFATSSFDVDLQSNLPVSQTVTLAVVGAGSRIEIVGTTPLPGVDLAVDQIAGPVQTGTAADIESSGSLDLADFMNRRLNGVSVNEMQGNPYQPDVNFRGYTASPLLGTPEGLSVYLDGVRQNQPFGDTVSWDLIPKNAISEITLMPGSNPVFGLNTLGGALSVQTKDGAGSPGLDGQLTYGSSGRKAVQAAYGGGSAAGFNWFLAANAFHESGWRSASPSDVRQGFSRTGWRSATTDLAFTASYAYNTLTGNGLQDYRLIQRNYSSVYSIPDSTANRAPAFNFIARHTFSDTLIFSGNAWFRNIRTETINGNLNTDAFDQSVYQPSSSEQAVLKAAGYSGFPTAGATAANTPFPKWRCIANALTLNDPDERCDAITIYSKEVQNEYGVSGQLTKLTSAHFGRNQLTVGGALDRGGVSYTQNTNYGYLDPNYRITAVPAWQDGSGSVSGSPVDSRVNLHGLTPNGSLFAADTLTLGNSVNVTLSGRFNRFRIDNTDRLNPTAGPGSLDGNYKFQRFNPAIGVTWSPIAAVNGYLSYTQGSRAPTSIELGCADPSHPCSLPNALASDPPLQQVETGTWEAGLRGKPEIPFFHGVRWSAGAFRAENRNDILFVSSPQTGTGYFRNFAKTRREGFDADLNGTTRVSTAVSTCIPAIEFR